MVFSKRLHRFTSHNSFRRTFQFSSYQPDFYACFGQPLCVRNSIRNNSYILITEELQHISGCRSCIQIYELSLSNQPSRIFCYTLLFRYMNCNFLCHCRLLWRHYVIRCNRTAKHFHQFSCIMKRCDISSHGRFRYIQKFFYFRYGNAALFFKKLQYLFITLFCKHMTSYRFSCMNLLTASHAASSSSPSNVNVTS